MLVEKNKISTLVVVSPYDMPFEQIAGIDHYKGIILLFDADLDERLFLFVKKYYERLIPCVKAVFETHGTVTLFTSKAPTILVKALKDSGADVDLDSWQVQVVDLTEFIDSTEKSYE